jgi:hypothetical protein
VNHSPLLILAHLVGYALSAGLYLLLVAMAIEGRQRPAGTGSAQPSTLMPLGIGLVGLLWNVGALLALVQPTSIFAPMAPAWIALGLFALGFLPAIVMHSASQQRPDPRDSDAFVLAAYLVSFGSGMVELLRLPFPEIPRSAPLTVLAIGYAVLIGALSFRASRARSQAPRLSSARLILAVACVLISAWHWESPTSKSMSLTMELAGHHASLLVVALVLYEDYRFALIDRFLRRAVWLVLVVATAALLQRLWWDGGPLMLSDQTAEPTLRSLQPLMMIVLAALLTPWLSRLSSLLVDRLILGRSDYAALRGSLRNELSAGRTEEDALSLTADTLRSALWAESVHWIPLSTGSSRRAAIQDIDGHPERLDVRTADGGGFALELRMPPGARRVLSEDRVLIDWVASELAHRVDALRFTEERHARDVRERAVSQLAAEAELRALRAQINPHFLFNALNTIGYLLQATPERALATLYRLTNLLRAVLRSSRESQSTLGEEIDLIEAYLAIEQERFEERLQVLIDVPSALRSLQFPPLLLQPLVENAIKHGVATTAAGGQVTVSARAMPSALDSATPPLLHLLVHDTAGTLTAEWSGVARGESMGLSIVAERLLKLFGSVASLSVLSDPSGGTRAEIWLPLASPPHFAAPATGAPHGDT